MIALDNWKTARAGDDAERLEAIYESRIADVLERHPVTRDTLLRAVNLQHGRWLIAQKKTTTLPPKA